MTIRGDTPALRSQISGALKRINRRFSDPIGSEMQRLRALTNAVVILGLILSLVWIDCAAEQGKSRPDISAPPAAPMGLSSALISNGASTADTPASPTAGKPGSIDELVRLQLARSTWVADGAANGRVIYVFTDMNCPYCNKLWKESRSEVAQGRLQLRHIIVGVVTPSSPGMAAALLQSRDPASTLQQYEAGRVPTSPWQRLLFWQTRPASIDLRPIENVPAALEEKLLFNQKLMNTLGLRGTPALVWLDSKNVPHIVSGGSKKLIDSILAEDTPAN